ncbi:MAG: sigma-E processing peptidase SpoIIGA [Oscillospiraceae bacterium]|nr:sigma-E processing peptidase SpoIIGA [Oscillospiraceae bacterium]
MTKTIYPDVLFLINFIINYLILFATAQISALPLRRRRLLSGAFIGAVYGVAVFIPQLEVLTSFFVKLGISSLMLLAAFGFKSHLKTLLLFFGISLIFAGAVFIASLAGLGRFIEIHNGIYYIHISALPLLSSTFAAYALLTLVFRRGAARAERKISKVSIFANGHSAELSALHDTGNSLRNPKDNTAVVIANYDCIRSLLSPSVQTLLDLTPKDAYPTLLDRLSPQGQFRLLPYKTVGVPFSLMLAFTPEKITVNGKVSESTLVAISPFAISDGNAYNALI